MDVLRFGDWVALGQDRTYADLSKVIQRLSSGLSISSAADNPSGLAISQRLLAQANGFQSGQQNIQSAVDLVQTADGGLQTISDILQRMRTLVVEGNSNLNSAQQTSYLQTEIDSLAQEINTVSGNTVFNGLHLLDGSLAAQPASPAQYDITQNDTLASGQPLVDPTSIGFNPSSVAAQVSVKVTADLGAPPPSPFNPSNDLLNVQITVSSPDPGFGAPQVENLQVFAGTNIVYVPGISPFPVPLTASFTAANQSGSDNIASFNLTAISQSDVGKQFFFYTVPPQNAQSTSGLSVNDGGGEGHITTVNIPGVNAQDLGVNQILLGTYTPDQVVNGNPNLTTAQGPMAAGEVNSDTNTAALYRIDHAITLLGQIRATLGAQTVSLQENAADAATAQTQLTASASAIRDTNVGADVVSFTRLQVLQQVQTSVLHSLFTDAQQVVTLVQRSLP